MDGKHQEIKQQQKTPVPPQQEGGGEGGHPDHNDTTTRNNSSSMLQQQEGQQEEEMPIQRKSPNLSLRSSNLLLDDILIDNANDELEEGDLKEQCNDHTQKDGKKLGEEIFEHELKKRATMIEVDDQKNSETVKSHRSTFSMKSDNDSKQGQPLKDDQIQPESRRDKESEEDNNDSNEVIAITHATTKELKGDDKDVKLGAILSGENPGDRTAETQSQQEESHDKNEQNIESTSQKDTKTKVRNLARNRRKKAKEWNEKKQEEIARLTKLNMQLKEKNQNLINELIMLGVDTSTIQLFLNCLHITNQELATSVPSPQYKFSLE